jgi:TRAP-type C4-dicarboxylate transport system substrate-binding protein
MKLLKAAAVSLISLAGLLPMASHAQAPIVMKLGTATINDAQHEWMKLFAKIVDKNSNGRIKVEIYPASQLGQSPQMIQGTQLNTIQGVVGPPEFLSGVDPRFQILSAPGLFKDLAHANRVLQDPTFNKAFLAVGANKGLKGLGLFISGPFVFVMRKPVDNLSDFNGRKVRVLAAPLQLEQVRAMNMTPVPMPLGDVMPALQQGTIDGVMSCTPVFAALKFYDAAKYLIETDHGLIAAETIISKIWFDHLPKDLQDVVEKAGEQASKDIYQFSVDDINRGREKWKANGGTIVKLPADQQAKLMSELIPVGTRVTSSNPGEKQLYEILKDAVDRNK